MDTITYENKTDLISMPNIEAKNKVTAANMNEIKNVVNSHAMELQNIQNTIADGTVPIGFIMEYPCGEIPNGYMECNGQNLNRADYPELFNTIGTTYGSDSPLTFKLPNSNYNPKNVPSNLIPKYIYIIRVI